MALIRFAGQSGEVPINIKQCLINILSYRLNHALVVWFKIVFEDITQHVEEGKALAERFLVGADVAIGVNVYMVIWMGTH
jgi:hypothetical protein